MNDSKKTTMELSGEDWSRVIREGSWDVSFEQELFRRHLGTKDVGDLRYSERSTRISSSLIIRFVLLEYFESKGLIIDKVINIGHDGEYCPVFSDIEYEYNTYRSCLSDGSYFLSSADGRKYLFTIEKYHDSIGFKCASHKDASPDGKELLEGLFVYAREHNFLKGKKIDAECNFIQVADHGWDDLILPKDQKDDLRKNLSNLIEFRDIYQKNHLVLKRGLMFCGPAGSGKTTLGKILAATIDWTFIWVTPQHLLHPRNIANIVELCKDLSPSVLFLEDIDLYGADRSENGNPAFLGELMNQLDGIQENKDIITIATTNKPEVLEKALLSRPGRFDRVIRFDKPNGKCRVSMFKHFLKDLALDAGISLEEIAKKTDGLMGAHIREVVNMAILQAIDEKSYDADKKILLKNDHFESAIAIAKKKDFGVSNTSSTSRTGFLSRGYDDDDDIEGLDD